jgi:hypothetical protein
MNRIAAGHVNLARPHMSHVQPQRRLTPQFPRTEPVRPSVRPERLRADRLQLLITDGPGGGREIDRLAPADLSRRIEDHDLDVVVLGQIARVPGLRRGHPVEVGVPRGRIKHRRQPETAIGIEGAQRHVLVDIDDPPRHRVQVRIRLRHTVTDRPGPSK